MKLEFSHCGCMYTDVNSSRRSGWAEDATSWSSTHNTYRFFLKVEYFQQAMAYPSNDLNFRYWRNTLFRPRRGNISQSWLTLVNHCSVSLSCFHLVADIICWDAEQIVFNSDGSLQVLEVDQHFCILLLHKTCLCTSTSNKLPVPFSPYHLPSIIP